MDSVHPDEGTIHAWLDDALGADEAARVSAHVEACSACQAAVAEARGLIAGASRVVRALDPDTVPVGGAQAPSWGGTAARASSGWRLPRITPARAAVAATVLVAAGVLVSRDWIAHDQIAPPVATRIVEAPAAALANPVRDSLLDSAIRRNVAKAVPPRVVARAPGPDVLAAKAPDVSPESADLSAGERVAEGRVQRRAMRMSAPVAADHAEAGVAAREAPERAVAVAGSLPIRADRPAPMAASASAPAAAAAPSRALSVGQCLRLEGTAPGATWGSVPLPLVVALVPGNDTSGVARIAGAERVGATWSRAAGDGLTLSLGGGAGSVRLGGRGDTLAGTMTSGGRVAGRVVATVVSCP